MSVITARPLTAVPLTARPLTAYALGTYMGGAAFSPADLFASGEQGGWWDASDLSTMWQDAAGTVPVTAAGQSVGLIRDKSGRNNHLSQSTPANRPVLTLDDDGDWCLKFDGSNTQLISPEFSAGSNKVTQWLAMQLDDLSGLGRVFVEFKGGTGADVGITNMGYGSDVAPPGYQAFSTGSLGLATTMISKKTALFVKENVVITAEHDISAPFTKLYRNGVAGTPSTVSQGTGNIGTHPLSVGCRLDNSYNFLGSFHQIIYLARAATAQEISNTNDWCQKKCSAVFRTILVGDIGDSAVSAYSTFKAVNSYVTETTNNLAVAGQTIAQQAAKWSAQDGPTKQSYVAVVIQVGLNNITPGSPASGPIGEIQDLVDTVAADTTETCKVFVASLTPCRARLVDLYGETVGEECYQKWLAINEAIAGGGATPITGADGRVTTHTATLNDGLGNLKPEYDSGDGIHENNEGRQVIAAAWDVALKGFGL